MNKKIQKCQAGAITLGAIPTASAAAPIVAPAVTSAIAPAAVLLAGGYGLKKAYDHARPAINDVITGAAQMINWQEDM